MVVAGKQRRSKASYALEAGSMSIIWVLNLWQMANTLRSMSLLAAITAGAIFLFAPVDIRNALLGYREYAP